MNRTTKALGGLALAGLAVLATAAPAQAVTHNGCTVNALTPYHNGDFNSSGKKQINYDVEISCTAAVEVTIYMERWEDDPNQVDDLIGTSTLHETFDGPGSTTRTVTGTLPNTDDGWDQQEEMYHRVRFTVTVDPVTSPLSNWDYSPIRQIQV